MSMYTKHNIRNSSSSRAALVIDSYVARGIPSLMSDQISRVHTLELVRENPSLFNLRAFSPHEKAALLISGYNVFKKHFDPADFSDSIMFALFLTNTARYEKYIDFSKITGIDMTLLLRRRPSYIEKVSDEFKKKFSYVVWSALLARNFIKNAPEFLENIDNIRAKTELRALYRKHIELFWMTEPEHIEKMVLSPKDFLLLSNKVDMRQAGVKLRKATIKALMSKLVITVLKGEDKQTPQLRNMLGRHK